MSEIKKDSKQIIDTNELSIIKDKKFESRANYAGNQEVIDEDLEEEYKNSSDK